MLYRTVKETIKKKALIEKGDRIVLGVSGGPDSTALLYILAGLKRFYGIELFAAHLNHLLRGRDSFRDADFVKDMAETMKIPCLIGESDVKKKARCLKMSVENAAREERYAFYERAAKRFMANKIATAHTLDDQAETVLMRLLKGAGSLGLSGIPYKRRLGNFLVIRPLLDAKRSDIERYLKKNKIPSRRDATNLKMIYLRNKIRNRLIPFLEKEFNPNIKERLAILAAIFGDESSYLNDIARRKMKKMARRTKEGVLLNVRDLNGIHPAIQRLIMRQAISAAKGGLKDIAYKHCDAVRLILDGTERKSVNLPAGIRIIRAGNNLLVSTERRGQNSRRRLAKTVRLEIPGKVLIPELSAIVKAEIVKHPPLFSGEKDKFTEYVNGDILTPTLKIRTRREGDRMKPLGMRSAKKLHDIFIDEKIPYETREKLPIILSGSDIVWAVGVKLSDDFRLKKDTEKIVKLTMSKFPHLS